VEAKGACGLGVDPAGDVGRVREWRRVWPLVHKMEWKGNKRKLTVSEHLELGVINKKKSKYLFIFMSPTFTSIID
jgi:hypothetical protein